jgi:hypothetical protein
MSSIARFVIFSKDQAAEFCRLADLVPVNKAELPSDVSHKLKLVPLEAQHQSVADHGFGITFRKRGETIRL